MSVQPEDILTVARNLSQGDSEANHRSAISRAYYAAYHKCRILASKVEPMTDFRRSSGHQDVPTALKKIGSKGMSVAYVLLLLQEKRKKADYDIDEELETEAARTAVQECVKVMTGVESADNVSSPLK